MFNKKANTDHDETARPLATPGASSAPSSTAPHASQTPPASTSTPGPQSTSAPTPTPAPMGGAETVLSEGCKFVGKAKVSGTIRIEGRAEGELQADDSLVVGKSGDVEAEVTARRAILNGKFQGKIEASDRVELQSGSRVEADIDAKNMVMEDGVRYRGHLKIGS